MFAIDPTYMERVVFIVSANDTNFYLNRDIDTAEYPAAPATPPNYYQDITFYGGIGYTTFPVTDAASRKTLAINGIAINQDTYDITENVPRTFQNLHSLHFMNVDTTIDSVYFHFSGTDQRLTLSNASIVAIRHGFGFRDDPGAVATVVSAAGDNVLEVFNPDVASEFHILVNPTTSLEIANTGNASGFDSNSLDVRTLHRVVVDNSTLRFRNTEAILTNGQVDVTNGGRLEVFGSGYRVSLDEIYFDSSTLQLGANTKVTSNYAGFIDSSIELGTGADFWGYSIKVDGTVAVNGNNSGLVHSTMRANNVYINENASLTVTNATTLTNFTDLFGGATLTVNGEDYQVGYALLAGAQPGGSTAPAHIVLENDAELRLGGDLVNAIPLNIDANDSSIYWNSKSYLLLNPDLTFTLTGNTGLNFRYGGLKGSGHIYGDANVNFFDQTVISPSDPVTGGSYGSITFDPAVDFGPLAEYRVSIGVDPTTGAPLNDVLKYGNGNFNANELIGKIYVTSGVTAADLHNKAFTIIHAADPSSTGTLYKSAFAQHIIEDASVPALIDFVVRDLNTNGHPDVTLLALEQHQSTLANHPWTHRNPNSKKLVAAIAATPGTTVLSNGTTLATALSSLTNGQVAQLSQTAHAEPYASFLTVGVEGQNLLSNMVMDHAVGAGEFAGIDDGSAPTDDRAGPRHRLWADVAHVQGRVEGQNDLGTFGYQLNQLVSGIDLIGGPDALLGAYLAAGGNQLHEHDSVTQTLKSSDFGLGLYGHALLGYDLQLTAMAGLGFGEVESRRVMPATIGAFTGGTAKAKFNTTSGYAGLRIHRAFQPNLLGGVKLTPSFGVTYIHSHAHETKERGGGDFNFQIAAEDAAALVFTPGLDLSKSFAIENGITIALDAKLRYEYDALAAATPEHEVRAASAVFGGLTQVGQNRGAHGITAGLGATAKFSNYFDAGLGYDYSLHSHGREHTFGANATLRW